MVKEKSARKSAVIVSGKELKFKRDGLIEYLSNKDNKLVSFSLELRLGRLSEGNRNEYIADLLSRIPQSYVHKETIPPNRDKPGCYHIVIERKP